MHAAGYFPRMQFEKQNFCVKGLTTFKVVYIAYFSQTIENRSHLQSY